MQDSTTKTAAGGRLPTFGPDTIETLMRARVRTTIEAIVQEELDAALGAAKSARVGETRQGYRHGSRERTLTTSLGPATIQMPRARIQAADGTTAEGTVKLTSRAHNCRSMTDCRHLSVGTRHLIPDAERARSQETVVGRPKQVAADTAEVEDESVHG